jgi:hypothetical protein
MNLSSTATALDHRELPIKLVVVEADRWASVECAVVVLRVVALEARMHVRQCRPRSWRGADRCSRRPYQGRARPTANCRALFRFGNAVQAGPALFSRSWFTSKSIEQWKTSKKIWSGGATTDRRGDERNCLSPPRRPRLSPPTHQQED